jgi:hypothetical protein
MAALPPKKAESNGIPPPALDLPVRPQARLGMECGLTVHVPVPG